MSENRSELEVLDEGRDAAEELAGCCASASGRK